MPLIPSVSERNWPTQIFSPISVAAVTGIVTVPSTQYLKVNQDVEVRIVGQPVLKLTVREVLDETTLRLGPLESPFRADPTIPTQLLPYSGGTMIVQEQVRSPIQPAVIDRAVYEEAPTVALRTIGVDWLGRFYSVDNPLPVQLSDGSINIETVNANLSVQLSAKDDDPIAGDVHDSVRIGDGVDEMVVNVDGSINVAQAGVWTISVSNFPTYDVGYGTVGTNTLRTAAQIGNAAGTAAFGPGVTDLQTLRVVLPTDQTPIPVAQSGVWATGRTWNLSSGIDSVASAQAGVWTVQQGTPPWQVVGNVASSATDTGNPIKVAGVFRTSLPTFADGQRGDLQVDSSGRLIISPLTSSSAVTSNQGLPNTVGNAWPIKVTNGTNTAEVSPNGDLETSDRLDHNASDTVVALTTVPVELKVGASTMTNRKLLIIEALSPNVVWGFSATTQSFDAFKSQTLMIPLGPDLHVWAKVTAGTGSISTGELA